MNAPCFRNAGLAALVAAALASLASPASAGHAYGHDRHGWRDDRDHRDRDERVAVRTWCPPPVRVIARPVACPPRVWVDPNDGLSVSFTGFVGGVAVNGRYGRPLANGYAYEDPYCGITFDSLEGYTEHCWHHHPAVVQVVARRGACERHDWRDRDARHFDDEDR